MARVLTFVIAAALSASGLEAEGALAARLRAAAPKGGWVGYSVPGVGGERICTGACSAKSPCTLRDDEGFMSRGDDSAGRTAAADGEPLRIYLRAGVTGWMRLRIFNESCRLDTRGQDVRFVDGVGAAESLEFLAELSRLGARSVSDAALVALAHHADAGADRWLTRFVEPGEKRELREHAAFWLGRLRGRNGYETVRRLLHDPDRQIREHAVFAISQSPVEGAQDELFRLARQSRDPEVRGKALFWLGQRAGERAVATLTAAADDDPELEVKRQAVFGLSQLPAEQGVPQLLRLARTHREPEVRKAALFWLGQSGDPRALALFEELLVGR